MKNTKAGNILFVVGIAVFFVLTAIQSTSGYTLSSSVNEEKIKIHRFIKSNNGFSKRGMIPELFLIGIAPVNVLQCTADFYFSKMVFDFWYVNFQVCILNCSRHH